MRTFGQNPNIIECRDDRNDHILLKEGDFKKIKNFDPADSAPEYLGLNNSDAIAFDKKVNDKTYWIQDRNSKEVYAFMLNDKGAVISGAFIEYSGSHSEMGIFNRRDKSTIFDMVVNRYEGSGADELKILNTLKQKISENTGVAKIDTPTLKEAIAIVSDVDMALGKKFASPGIGGVKEPNQVG